MNLLRCEESDGILILYFNVPILLAEKQFQALQADLFRFCDEAAPTGKKIILDFCGLQRVSSAVVGVLVLFNKRAKDHGLNWRLRNLTPAVQDILRRSRLDKAFPTCREGDPDPFRVLRFEADLFEVRNDVLEVLQERGFEWMGHFTSVNLLHDVFGIDVCGIKEKVDAIAIQALLIDMYPKWRAG